LKTPYRRPLFCLIQYELAQIELDPEELKLHPLQVGLSMQVDIDVSDYKK